MDYTKHDINHHLDVDDGTNDLGDYSAKGGSRGCVPPEGRRACESADLAEHVCWLGRRLAQRCCLRLLRELLSSLTLASLLCSATPPYWMSTCYCSTTAAMLGCWFAGLHASLMSLVSCQVFGRKRWQQTSSY